MTIKYLTGVVCLSAKYAPVFTPVLRAGRKAVALRGTSLLQYCIAGRTPSCKVNMIVGGDLQCILYTSNLVNYLVLHHSTLPAWRPLKLARGPRPASGHHSTRHWMRPGTQPEPLRVIHMNNARRITVHHILSSCKRLERASSAAPSAGTASSPTISALLTVRVAPPHPPPWAASPAASHDQDPPCMQGCRPMGPIAAALWTNIRMGLFVRPCLPLLAMLPVTDGTLLAQLWCFAHEFAVWQTQPSAQLAQVTDC
jgi:hypothetical protein